MFISLLRYLTQQLYAVRPATNLARGKSAKKSLRRHLRMHDHSPMKGLPYYGHLWKPYALPANRPGLCSTSSASTLSSFLGIRKHSFGRGFWRRKFLSYGGECKFWSGGKPSVGWKIDQDAETIGELTGDLDDYLIRLMDPVMACLQESGHNIDHMPIGDMDGVPSLYWGL